MKIEYINPFIEATEQTYSTMCNMEVQRNGQLSVRAPGDGPEFDLVGVIGMSGAVKGVVLMTMNKDVGRKAVTSFLDEKNISNNELMDGFGELLNIISGAAAAKLGRVDLAIPTVISGSSQHINSPKGAPWIIIPMELPDCGKFHIEIAIEEAAS